MQPQQPTMTARAGLLMVMTAAFFWGTGNVVARTIYDLADTNAISVATWRMALAVPALLLLGTLTQGRRLWSIHWQDLPLMLSAGALVALYQVSFYAALPRAGVAIATVVALCSAPVVVAVLSALVLRERPTSRTIGALTAAVMGTSLLINVQNSTQRPDIFGGVLLALLAGTLYAINTLVGRRLGSGRRVHPLQTVTIGFGFGALILVLIALPAGLTWSYPATGWLRLAYLGVIPTAVGYGLFFGGMRTVTATAASVATLLEPLTSTVIAVLLLHEPLSPQGLVGSILLILAMLILLLRRR